MCALVFSYEIIPLARLPIGTTQEGMLRAGRHGTGRIGAARSSCEAGVRVRIHALQAPALQRA